MSETHSSQPGRIDTPMMAPGGSSGRNKSESLSLSCQLIIQTLASPSFPSLPSRDQLRLVHAVLDKCSRMGTPILSLPQFEVQRDTERQLDSFDRLRDWMENTCGAYINEKVCIGSSKAEGNGLFVRDGIPSGIDPSSDCIVRVPKKAMLSNDSIGKLPKPLKNLFRKDPLLKSNPSIALTFLLVCERLRGDASASFWAPYLDTLPLTFSTPLFYSLEDLQRVQDISGRALKAIVAYLINASKQYSYLCKVLLEQDEGTLPFDIGDFSFDAFRWALSVVMTRQNRIPSDSDFGAKDATGGDFCFALIPFWDLMNHKEGLMTTEFDVESNCLECKPMEMTSPGDQVYMCYGKRNNLNLLIYSGFAYKNNTYHGVVLKLGVSAGDKLYQQKCSLLRAIGLKEPPSADNTNAGSKPAPFSLEFVVGAEGIEPHLMAFLRVFVMTEEEFAARSSQEGAKAGGEDLLESPINNANEVRALTFLKNRITLMLKACDSSADDDMKLIQSLDDLDGLANFQANNPKENAMFTKYIVSLNLSEKLVFEKILLVVNDKISALTD